jgi:hypothetical protein
VGPFACDWKFNIVKTGLNDIHKLFFPQIVSGGDVGADFIVCDANGRVAFDVTRSEEGIGVSHLVPPGPVQPDGQRFGGLLGLILPSSAEH